MGKNSPKIPLESAARDKFEPSRRSFLKGVGIAAGAAAVLPSLTRRELPAQPAVADDDAPATPGLRELGREARSITLRINGRDHSVRVEPRTTLLEALRTHLDLTGSKEVCDRGSCGCCTVLMNGHAVMSCMMLAMDAVDAEIMTVEGIAADPRYRHLIESFCEHDAAQCGYCIPGFVVRSAELLREVPNPTPEQIRDGLAGNVCRCGTYTKIFDAVAACARKGGVA